MTNESDSGSTQSHQQDDQNQLDYNTVDSNDVDHSQNVNDDYQADETGDSSEPITTELHDVENTSRVDANTEQEQQVEETGTFSYGHPRDLARFNTPAEQKQQNDKIYNLWFQRDADGEFIYKVLLDLPRDAPTFDAGTLETAWTELEEDDAETIPFDLPCGDNESYKCKCTSCQNVFLQDGANFEWGGDHSIATWDVINKVIHPHMQALNKKGGNCMYWGVIAFSKWEKDLYGALNDVKQLVMISMATCVKKTPATPENATSSGSLETWIDTAVEKYITAMSGKEDYPWNKISDFIKTNGNTMNNIIEGEVKDYLLEKCPVCINANKQSSGKDLNQALRENLHKYVANELRGIKDSLKNEFRSKDFYMFVRKNYDLASRLANDINCQLGSFNDAGFIKTLGTKKKENFYRPFMLRPSIYHFLYEGQRFWRLGSDEFSSPRRPSPANNP